MMTFEQQYIEMRLRSVGVKHFLVGVPMHRPFPGGPLNIEFDGEGARCYETGQSEGYKSSDKALISLGNALARWAQPRIVGMKWPVWYWRTYPEVSLVQTLWVPYLRGVLVDV